MTESRLSQSSAVRLVLLAALTMIAPLTVDMYLPTFPTIATALQADPALVQVTLSVFMVGFAAGQLSYGPFSDRFGRKPPLAFGMVLFAVACVGAATAESIETLIVWRFLQGVGGAAGPVLARAIARDLFGREKAASALSLMTLIMGLAPMLAPFTGGVILEAWGWRAVFIVLATFGSVAWACSALVLPESLALSARTAMGPAMVLKAFTSLLRNRRFLGYALCAGCSSAALFAYITSSPFVFMGYFGVEPLTYTYLFGTNVIGFMLGALVNSILVRRLGVDRLLLVSTTVAGAMGAILFLTKHLFDPGLVGFMIALFLFMPSISMTNANATAGGLSESPTMIGSASSLLGGLSFLMGASSGALAGLLHDGTNTALVTVVGIAGLASAACRWFLIGPTTRRV
ncbi:MAG: Bcr/CflA family multidrug efflux MFS transporter [Alphaproteobacteria bacterium]|nr:Bcr/CflA family multidrug efflux MFS transporter [Alphaproteobacteria bacterium]